MAWEGPGKLRAAIERGKAGARGEREGARNRRERLVVGRSVEARSREPADEPSLKSRVFHDERARHNDRERQRESGDKGERERRWGRGEGERGGGVPEGLRPVTRCNSLAKSHFGKNICEIGTVKKLHESENVR